MQAPGASRVAISTSAATAARHVARGKAGDLRPGRALPDTLQDNVLMAPPVAHGRRRAGSAQRPAVSALGLAVGVVAAGVAWVALVITAVDFGRRARAGEALGWVFLIVGAVGATACLLLGLLLGARLLTLVGLLDAYHPKRAARRRGLTSGD